LLPGGEGRCRNCPLAGHCEKSILFKHEVEEERRGGIIVVREKIRDGPSVVKQVEIAYLGVPDRTSKTNDLKFEEGVI